MSKSHKSSPPDPEAEFLVEQAKLARRALGTVFSEMERNLLRSADVRAWAVRYPLPTVAAAAAAGLGAGVAVKSLIHSNGKGTNGTAENGPPTAAPQVPLEASPNEPAATKPGTIASGLRWLASGLAAAAAEALIAATRRQIESALAKPRDGETRSEKSV